MAMHDDHYPDLTLKDVEAALKGNPSPDEREKLEASARAKRRQATIDETIASQP